MQMYNEILLIGTENENAHLVEILTITKGVAIETETMADRVTDMKDQDLEMVSGYMNNMHLQSSR